MPSPATDSRFRDLFGRDAEQSAAAPGRVNLIGEHTDYHEGYVLPTVIPQRTVVHGARRGDGLARVWSSGISPDIVDYVIGAELRGRGWLDYVQGVTATLVAAGHPIGGLDLMIRSGVPPGAGVSSSAALAVAVLRLLRSLWALELDDVEIARAAQRSESTFVGAPVGIMDPMVCSLGVEREALFLDTRTLTRTVVPIPPTAEVVVVDSGQSHRHAGGEYVTRRRESFEAARQLGVSHLRDVDAAALAAARGLSPLLTRRARHVVTENQRVLDTVAALRGGDMRAAGALLDRSHQSLRDDYEVSTPEIDALVASAQRHPDVYGARLTGGGFGGSVVMLVRGGAGRASSRAIASDYTGRTGLNAVVLMPQS
jgi:galactokinase